MDRVEMPSLALPSHSAAITVTKYSVRDCMKGLQGWQWAEMNTATAYSARDCRKGLFRFSLFRYLQFRQVVVAYS